MTIPPRKPPPLPNRQQVLEFIQQSQGQVDKRELARAFHLKGPDRIHLKTILKELEGEGAIARTQTRRFSRPGALPEVSIIEITGSDTDGDLVGRPIAWEEPGQVPRIVLGPMRKNDVIVGVGDRVLARLRHLRADLYEAQVIRVVGERKARVLGVYEVMADGSGRIHPTNRREKADYQVPKGEDRGALAGELVLADLLPGRFYGLRQAAIRERLGKMGEARSVSLIAIHTYGIPDNFPDDVRDQAQKSAEAPLADREDLRSMPLVTIDGADARDFDDAVWAEADRDPANPGGWCCMVAIADVSWYVRPGDALDKEAYQRGNSVYFPDRVVPMLPEELSNGWCSLKPDEDRPCLAVRFRISKDGAVLEQRFLRGLMRSVMRFTYERIQAVKDGLNDVDVMPLMDTVVTPLYGAWQSLLTAREARGALELDLPERKVVLSPEGQVLGISPRQRLDSHRLIEDFMIQANVCAATELERLRQPCMYRVHDSPSVEKLESLRQFLDSLEMGLPKGQVPRPAHFNRILAQVKGTEHEVLVNEVILRSQAQAVYAPENLGHFGLGLVRYAHFTSPIRRYADLLVHRALVSGLKLGEGALPADAVSEFPAQGVHISMTERRAATAEREAVDRYVTAYLSSRVGATFAARISGVARFGLFVCLAETGADGLVPASSLPDDSYMHDEAQHALIGRRTRKMFQLGAVIEVVLKEANTVTGGMVFALSSASATGKPSGAARQQRPPPRYPGSRPPKKSASRRPRQKT
jgi:ribonuclease R